MDTKYWIRKKDHFAHKCAMQEPAQDGRIQREWTNPQTGEIGSTWEHHQSQFKGLIEYIDLKEGLYGGWEFYLGLQGDQTVDVLQFKVFTGKGKMVDTLIPVIRKVTNLLVDSPLQVDLYTPPNQDKYVKTYTTLRQDGKPVPEAFNKVSEDPSNPKARMVWEDIPPPEIKEGIGGKKVYDFLERDKYLFNHLSMWVDENKDLFAKNKELRPQTDNESYANQVENLPKKTESAGDIQDGDPF